MSTPYWTDGSVSLYLGDCRTVTEWMSADVLVTDPPYGIAYGGGPANRRNSARKGIAGDGDLTVRDSALALWGDRLAAVFGDPILPSPSGSKQVLVYLKAPGAGFMGARSGFRRDVEFVYLAGPWPVEPPARSSILKTGARWTDVTAKQYGHPHAKPVDVMETLIGSCPPGVIADPFAGSGSTLVAARNQGRRAIGVEIDERYCETIARRLDQSVMDFGEMAAS